jgi:mannose-6-phosphate isomerase-like protein (cupin superfamily)
MEIKKLSDNIVFNDNNLTKRVLFTNKDVLCFVLNLIPGQVLPVHKHENSSLVLNVLSGACDLKINDETVQLTQGDVVFVKGEDDFSIPSVSEKLTLYVTICPNPSSHLFSQNFG